jgi:hypothetical protein
MTKKVDLSVKWLDREREPTQPPNLAYPDGIDVDLSRGGEGCYSDLPYPAKRCGMFVIRCRVCGTDAMITTAGRRDDPRSVKLRCAVQGITQ